MSVAIDIQVGDRDAFAALMRRYNQRVYRIARSILRDDAEAEDAAQEAWVSAWRHLDQLTTGASFPAWLSRIVAREAISRRRRRQLVLVENLEENPMDQPNPEQETQRAQARALLESVVDGLPDDFRVVFVLRSVEEMSVAETAACLDIPEATVKTRLHRARRLLRERLVAAAGKDVYTFAGDRCDRITQAVLARIA